MDAVSTHLQDESIFRFISYSVNPSPGKYLPVCGCLSCLDKIMRAEAVPWPLLSPAAP